MNTNPNEAPSGMSPDFADMLELADLARCPPPFGSVTFDDPCATSPDFVHQLCTIGALGNLDNSARLPVATPAVIEDIDEQADLATGRLEEGFKMLARLYADPSGLSLEHRRGAMDAASGQLASDAVRLASLIVLKKLATEHNARHAALRAA